MMHKNRKVYITGETTFDIIFKDDKPQQARVGGSQLNTCVSLGRLGVPVEFITMFGNDKVGEISSRFLKDNSIDDSHVTRYNGNSRIALAFLDKDNNAEYTFFKPSVKQSMKFPRPQKDDIVLFGSSFAVKEEGRKELLSFIEDAAANGAIIVYDPNFRKSNAKDIAPIKKMIEHNIAIADIVKGSDEDFINIFRAKDVNSAYGAIQKAKKTPLVYTANKEGIYVKTPHFNKYYKVPSIQPVSTIGAGDTFSAGLIYRLFREGTGKDDIAAISEQQWDVIIQTATSFAQHVCMHYDNYLTEDFAAEQAR